MFCLCFAFGDFQIAVNEIVKDMVRFPPAPLNFSLDQCFLELILFQIYISTLLKYYC